MDIKRVENDSKGIYSLALPDIEGKAELTFSKVGDNIIIIDHTEVPESMRGLGAGQKLLERAIEDARQASIKIIPLCPFANAQFKRHPEWHDVLNT